MSSFTEIGSNCVPFSIANGDSWSIDWHGFEEWLRRKGFTEKYRAEVLRCAKKHADSLSHGKLDMLDRNSMASLANLSKFLGVYKRFKEMREENGLKWTATVTAENAFLKLYSGEKDVKDVEAWMAEAKGKARYDIWIPTVFCAVSGLRTGEVGSV